MVQRLTDAVGSGEIEFEVSPEDDDLQSEIDSLRFMVKSLTALIQRQMSANVHLSLSRVDERCLSRSKGAEKARA